MAEARKFITRIDRKHDFGNNMFVEGKILGIAEALGINRNEEGIPFGIGKDENYRYIETVCTEEEFAKFREIVGRNYDHGKFVGLVEFDI